jgi:hypothetical protein
MVRCVRLALLLILISVTPGHAQDPAAKDPFVMEKLKQVVTAAAVISSSKERVDDEMNETRGGNNSGTPLGCYTLCPRKRQFASGYVDESADTVVSWTYDLHIFLSGDHPYDIEYMPGYRTVRDFSVGWWKKHSERFSAQPSMRQSAWVYEAILDGVQIWDRYQLLNGQSSATTLSYFDGMLASYENALPSDIFF